MVRPGYGEPAFSEFGGNLSTRHGVYRRAVRRILRQSDMSLVVSTHGRVLFGRVYLRRDPIFRVGLSGGLDFDDEFVRGGVEVDVFDLAGDGGGGCFGVGGAVADSLSLFDFVAGFDGQVVGCIDSQDDGRRIHTGQGQLARSVEISPLGSGAGCGSLAKGV